MAFTIIPHKYICPITRELIETPARIQGDPTNTWYEASAIAIWFADHNTMPTTNQIAPSTQLIIDPQDKQEIRNFFAQICNLEVFQTAVQSGHADQVAQLNYTSTHLSKHQGTTPLHIAAKNGYVEIVKLLLYNYLELIKHQAATMESEKAKEYVIRSQADVLNFKNNAGLTPIYIAAQQGHIEIIRLFKGFAPNMNLDLKCGEESFTPLLIAAKNGHFDLMTLLVDLGANIQAGGHTGITLSHLAVIAKDTLLMEFLQKKGWFNCEAKTISGATPLCHAIYQKNNIVIKFLVESLHANTDIILNDGTTALNIAAMVDNEEAIVMILNHSENNAMVNKKNPYTGKNALHVAAEFGSVRVAKYLIDNKVDINAMVADTGDTALHLAAKHNRTHVIKLLLEKGAYEELTNKANLNCFQVAKQNNHNEVCNIFMDHHHRIKNELLKVPQELSSLKEIMLSMQQHFEKRSMETAQELAELKNLVKGLLAKETSSNKSIKMIASSENLQIALQVDSQTTVQNITQFSEVFPKSPTHSPSLKRIKLTETNAGELSPNNM